MASSDDTVSTELSFHERLNAAPNQSYRFLRSKALSSRLTNRRESEKKLSQAIKKAGRQEQTAENMRNSIAAFEHRAGLRMASENTPTVFPLDVETDGVRGLHAHYDYFSTRRRPVPQLQARSFKPTTGTPRPAVLDIPKTARLSDWGAPTRPRPPPAHERDRPATARAEPRYTLVEPIFLRAGEATIRPHAPPTAPSHGVSRSYHDVLGFDDRRLRSSVMYRDAQREKKVQRKRREKNQLEKLATVLPRREARRSALKSSRQSTEMIWDYIKPLRGVPTAPDTRGYPSIVVNSLDASLEKSQARLHGDSDSSDEGAIMPKPRSRRAVRTHGKMTAAQLEIEEQMREIEQFEIRMLDLATTNMVQDVLQD